MASVSTACHSTQEGKVIQFCLSRAAVMSKAPIVIYFGKASVIIKGALSLRTLSERTYAPNEAKAE